MAAPGERSGTSGVDPKRSFDLIQFFSTYLVRTGRRSEVEALFERKKCLAKIVATANLRSTEKPVCDRGESRFRGTPPPK
jgi:hypothetical protein